MRTLHSMAIVVACSAPGCDAVTTPTTRASLEQPSACAAVLPTKVSWDGKSPVPIPPPETEDSTVLIFQSPEEPTEMWSFSTDSDKITSWVTFPTAALGELVTQVTSPAEQKTERKTTRRTSVVKIRVPKGPRLDSLARDVAFEAQIEKSVGDESQQQSDQCDSMGSGK